MITIQYELALSPLLLFSGERGRHEDFPVSGERFRWLLECSISGTRLFLMMPCFLLQAI